MRPEVLTIIILAVQTIPFTWIMMELLRADNNDSETLAVRPGQIANAVPQNDEKEGQSVNKPGAIG